MEISFTIDSVTQNYGSGRITFPPLPETTSVLLCNKFFSGICIIDGISVKFSYSPYFNDGDLLGAEKLGSIEYTMLKNIIVGYAAGLASNMRHGGK